jgi:hypothetical protein
MAKIKIILSLVLLTSRYKPLTVILREEHQLQMFESRVLREMFEPKKEKGNENLGYRISNIRDIYTSTSSLLTPWCRILFEKLIVTQLAKKYPAFLWNPKVHYRVERSPPLVPILSLLNPVRPIDPYLPKVHINVILPHTLRSIGIVIIVKYRAGG